MKTCNATTVRLIRSYLASLDTPRSLAVWMMFTNNEHDQLIALDIDPDDYLEPRSFRADYLATKFLSKATFLNTSVNKKDVAIKGFLDAERSCKEVNQDRFRTAYLKHKRFEWLHNAIIRKISFVLGDFDGDEICDRANWGPGVTLNRNVKVDTSATNKFRFENGITRDLFDLIGELHVLAYPTWVVKFQPVIGSKIVTVPKNSKTDRTIAVEPGINLWYQLGIGNTIRNRLLKVGIDLRNQGRNQSLAYSSSISGELATVDFSAASDSISIATVEALLPPRWFLLMNCCRSMYGHLEGQTAPLKFEKFSSMGNGFTFQLESLIFYAIAVCVVEYLQLDTSNVSVYGDDVIIPVSAFKLYREICEIYGFRVNVQKSFFSGVFRESCGSHYFMGIDCKPYYLREVVKGECDLYLAANSIRRIAFDRKNIFCDANFKECWQFLVSKVKRPCLISEGYGDSGFIVNFDEACPHRARNFIEGYYCRALVTVPLGYYSDDHPLLLARLKGGSVELSYGNITFLRGRSKKFRKKLFIRRWANLGPWL